MTSGFGFFRVSTTVCGSVVAMLRMLANTALSLFTDPGATARSNENLTVDASHRPSDLKSFDFPAQKSGLSAVGTLE